MKLLRQYIRDTMLTESIHPKIAGMIDKLEELMAYKDGKYEYKIIFIGDDEEIDIELLKIHKAKQRPLEIGHVQAYTGISGEPCLGAYEVQWASSWDKLGIGPLMYELAMEYASQEGGGLMCDRTTLSKEAYAVWEKYLKMRCKMEWNKDADKAICTSGDIEIKQLDHKHWPETPQKNDDCPQDTSQEYYRHKTRKQPTVDDHDEYMDYFHYEDPISKVYIKKVPSVIKRLWDIIEWPNGSPGWI